MNKQADLAFFSYSRHDSEFALKLAKDLRAAGAAVWLDQIDIDPGEHWDSAVEKALANSSKMLVVLSPSSVESTNVMDEVSFALDENKRVIPVLHRDCKIPFRLRRLQYIDLRAEYEKGLSELVRMLTRHEDRETAESVSSSATSRPDVPVSQSAAESLAIEQGKRNRFFQESAEAQGHAKERSDVEGRGREDSQPERLLRDGADRERPEEADQGRIAQQRAEAGHQTERKRAEEPGEGKVAGPSRRTYLIGASAALVGLLGLAMGLMNRSQNPLRVASPEVLPPSSESGTPESTQHGSEAAGPPSTKQVLWPDSTTWVKQFLKASEGPEVDSLRPYFGDFVSPYYGIPTASWDAIKADKQKYFARFPTIHYVLLGQPVLTNLEGGGAEVEFDVQYSNLRKDGRTLEGTSHITLNMSYADGRWVITGARERGGG